MPSGRTPLTANPSLDLVTLFGRALPAAAMVAAILLFVDLVCGLALRPTTPNSPREAFGPWIVDAGLVVAASMVLATIEVVAAGLVLRYVRFDGSWRAAARVAALAVCIVLPVLFLLARQPFAGTRYQGTSIAIYGPWAVLPLLMATTAAVAMVLLRGLTVLFTPTSSMAAWISVFIAVLLSTVAVIGIDALWYVGWYPLIHTILSVTSASGVLVLCLAAMDRVGRVYAPRRGFAILVVSVAGIAVVAVAFHKPYDAWRIASGTVFGSRILTPVLEMTAGTSLDVENLPDIAPQTVWPRVLGGKTGPAVADNVLMVTVDALRADHLGVYGDGRQLTPTIDRFFSDAVIAERAYAHYASTRFSVRAILQSQYRPSEADGFADGLVNVMRNHGYTTVAVLPEDVRLFVNLEFYNFSRVAFYDDPRDILSRVRELTSDLPVRSTFVWVHLYQPHDPYTPPQELRSSRSMAGGYAGEVRWVDRQFGEILQQLRPSDRTLVLFGADHGEELFDHGGTVHGRTVYEETIRVPLLMRIPGTAGMRLTEPVANLDIAPSVLARLGIDAPETYEGFDILREPSTAPADRVIFSESVLDVVGAIQGRYKWIYSERTGMWELYDLISDPLERRNLAASQADRLRYGQGLIWGYQYPSTHRTRLRRMDDAQLGHWVARQVGPQRASSPLTRWVIFDLAARVSDRADVRQWLRQAYAQESDEACRQAIVASLGAPRDEAEATWLHATGEERDRLSVSTDLHGSGLDHQDPEARIRAIRALRANPDPRDLLLTRWSVETSPAVRQAIIESLMELSRADGERLFATEVETSSLSAFARAQIIRKYKLRGHLNHLEDVFRDYESNYLRRFIIAAIPELASSAEAAETLTRLRDGTFEPELRAEIGRLISSQRVRAAGE
jgi:glucan phosphoethanolaminetransferase (alkaline phosphatase superfamily)